MSYYENQFILICFTSVSYTHLDVYKRQHCGLLYLAKTTLILCIAVKKAENTTACIGMEKRAQAFKLLPVPV